MTIARRSAWMLLAALAVAVPSARAADVPVRYLVERSALGDAVAGTDILFEFYDDPLCTASIHAELVEIDDVALYEVRRLRLRGLPPASRGVDLRHTVRDVPAGSPLFLSVTGPGIAPLGSPCQVQAPVSGEGPGSMGPAGPAGAPGPMPMIVDSAGTLVGIPFAADDLGIDAVVLQLGDTTTNISLFNLRHLENSYSLFYPNLDCSGPAYILAGVGLFSSARPVGPILYYQSGPPEFWLTEYSASFLTSQEACERAGGTFSPPASCCTRRQAVTPTPLAPTATFDLGQFVPPYRIEMRYGGQEFLRLRCAAPPRARGRRRIDSEW